MKKRSNLFVAISIFVIFIFLFAPFSNLYASSLEDQLEQIKKEKEQTQEKIEETEKQEKEYLNQVNQVEGELLDSLDELNRLNSELENVKSNIDKTNIDLAIKENELIEINKDLEEKKAILNNRVAAIYKNSNNSNFSFFEVLFKSKSFTEILSKLKLMNLLADQDAKIVEDIKNKKSAVLSVRQSIIDLKKKQDEQKSNLEKLIVQAEQKKQEVSNILDEKTALLSSTRANKKHF